MIKAMALKPVTANTVMPVVKNMQIHVHPSEPYPLAVEDMAMKMLGMYEEIEDVLTAFYKNDDYEDVKFHVSTEGKSEEQVKEILAWFSEMKGLIKEYHHNPVEKCLKGCLEDGIRVRKFLKGGFLEIAMEKVTEGIVKELAERYRVPYEVNRNVEVVLYGNVQNEFDLVVVFDGTMYIVEIKSGKNFRDFSKYYKIARKYGISEKRMLLFNSQLDDQAAEMAEYFCEYRVATLHNFKEKLTDMIEADQEVKRYA